MTVCSVSNRICAVWIQLRMNTIPSSLDHPTNCGACAEAVPWAVISGVHQPCATIPCTQLLVLFTKPCSRKDPLKRRSTRDGETLMQLAHSLSSRCAHLERWAMSIFIRYKMRRHIVTARYLKCIWGSNLTRWLSFS